MRARRVPTLPVLAPGLASALLLALVACSGGDPASAPRGTSPTTSAPTTSPTTTSTPTTATPRPVRRPDKALLRAARAGDADLTARALASGGETETRDAERRTPLLLAVTHDHVEVARLLLGAGADPDAVDGQQDTPWLVTGVTGSVPMARLLHAYDPDLTARNRFGGTSLIPASERGHVAYVRWVVRHTEMDLDHVNDLGWTALLEAVVLGRGTEPWQRIVRLLLDAGASPTIADHDGVTPLEHARSRGYDEIAALLER
ncbi:MAG: ankyrin repeat domain-containing protein [Nocardioides sp.]|uniref:ankyrin repeat domain-containing protein n=1 Tax=Nocardioides sp. TaxID=35761 RepID=UPI003F046867